MSKVLTFRETAKLLGVKLSTLKQRYQKWGIPWFRLGEAPNCGIRFFESDVIKWAKLRQDKAMAPQRLKERRQQAAVDRELERIEKK